jgi:hypothetical protein
MFRYSLFSDFYHQKRQQESSNTTTNQIVDGSLAKEVNVDSCPVVCRAPSRVWWEQAWHMRRR